MVVWISAFIFFIVNFVLIILLDLSPEDEEEMSVALAGWVVLLVIIGFISFVVLLVFTILAIVRKKSLSKGKVNTHPMNSNERICPNCGTAVDSQCNFCLNCGNKLMAQNPEIFIFDGDTPQKDVTEEIVPSYESSKPSGFMDYYRAMFYGTPTSNVVIIGASLLILALGIYMLIKVPPSGFKVILYVSYVQVA